MKAKDYTKVSEKVDKEGLCKSIKEKNAIKTGQIVTK